MTTFITAAAKEWLANLDAGTAPIADLEDWDAEQVEALRNELNTLAKTPDTRWDRAERGRIAVEIFGMNDDIDTMAADVIADILHWVANQSGPDLAGATHFRAAGYYNEER